MTITRGSDGAVYVCCGSYNPADEYNTEFYALHFFSNAGGAWHEMEAITGNSSWGPMYMYPCSMCVAPDRYGNDRIHLAYTLWTLPSFISVWYTYYEESGWHPSQELDTLHTSLSPYIAVDPAGVVHVVYTWYADELNRTMMYVRGTPGEAQNQ